MKKVLLNFYLIDRFIRMHIRTSRALYFRVPMVGRTLSLIMDRILMILLGIELRSESVDVRALAVPHPGGVLLGGNGIRSTGRVAVMAGVKFVGRAPSDEEYLRRHRDRCVFILGDNVVIGANSVVIGPVEICDNVVVSAMSLVNRSILEPGIYGGVPARKLREGIPGDEWVSYLPAAE